MKKVHKIIGLFLAFVLVAFVGVNVYATLVNTQINACVKKDGTMRVVSSASSCVKGENLLTWNTVGPQGPKGDMGPIGPQGLQGLAGLKGDKGDAGSAGPAGPQGPIGETGPMGPQGPAGNGGGSSLHLYDANNQDLGIYTGLANDQTIYLSFTTGLVLKTYSNDNQRTAYVYPVKNSPIYFESNDCTGTPFFPSVGDTLYGNRITSRIFLAGNFHYYTTLNVDSISRTSHSKVDTDMSGACVVDTVGPNQSLQLQEVTLPFTEPLAWPLHIQ